jgi:hypothetical protein
MFSYLEVLTNNNNNNNSSKSSGLEPGDFLMELITATYTQSV